MFRVLVSNESQNQLLEHDNGPLELGRGPQRACPRCIVNDPTVSRDQLRVEEVGVGRVRVENLSQKRKVWPGDGICLAPGDHRELELPVRLTVGATQVEITQGGAEIFETESLLTISQPLRGPFRPDLARALSLQGEGASALERLAQWLETVIGLHRVAIGATEFHKQSARALVELIGLDLGLVLLRRDNDWIIAASHAGNDRVTVRFSRTLVNRVANEKRTFYESMGNLPSDAASLRDISTAVVSPIFALHDEVVGVLYGVRMFGARGGNDIRPLEAQLVQLLAAAAGTHLTRERAVRTRTQFEQFFSPQLVRELEYNPGLLEGRTQEVTILVSDLRGFTSLTERLEAQDTCQLVRELLDRLSEQIVQHGGVIVDYAGDGILAMWNAPKEQDDHAVRACRAALAMQEQIPLLNAHWKDRVKEDLKLGIGLNTGPAQVGNTGSQRMLKYGPHGHTVNIASRVQDLTKKLEAPILITRTTQEKLPPTFATHRQGAFRPPGVNEDVVLYVLEAERDLAITDEHPVVKVDGSP